MGFSTYGRTYHLTTSNTGLGAPANGPADAGPFTREAGYWSFYEVHLIYEAFFSNSKHTGHGSQNTLRYIVLLFVYLFVCH